MYVNYYTREMMNEGEDNKQIFASKYKLYLPTEEEFKKELNLENYVKKDDSLENDSLTNEDEQKL